MPDHGVRLLVDENGNYYLDYTKVRARSSKRFTSVVGSGLKQTYGAVYDQHHDRAFYKDKVIDADARIQSFKDSCLIENIIKRCIGGDLTALHKKQGSYGDFTSIPTGDPRYIHDLMNNLKSLYNGLSDDEKKQYGNDLSSFIGSMQSDSALASFLEGRGLIKKKADAPVVVNNGGDDNGTE